MRLFKHLVYGGLLAAAISPALANVAVMPFLSILSVKRLSMLAMV